MRSVRLESALESRLEEAARITGQPVSKIIREAVKKRCDEVLGDSLDQRLADVVGVVSAGGNSRKTGKDFAKLLEPRSKSKTAKPRRKAKR